MNAYKPVEGDLLFQDLDCGLTCDAIEEVTWGRDSVKFSHIGLVVSDDEGWKVLEAVSIGVTLTPLHEFLKRSSDKNGNPKVWVGRVKEDYNSILVSLINNVPDVLGMEYDDEFIYNNGKYYCSELIYDLFKEANHNNAFFELEPMTFKSLKTGEFFPVWIEYYQKLNVPIPQDSLGINPAGISRSEKIEIVNKLGDIEERGYFDMR
ncbi:MAG: YiiX/YebB-like N1pC/P60 family cysteine hydrolase [Bacteroidota bacterium]